MLADFYGWLFDPELCEMFYICSTSFLWVLQFPPSTSNHAIVCVWECGLGEIHHKPLLETYHTSRFRVLPSHPQTAFFFGTFWSRPKCSIESFFLKLLENSLIPKCFKTNLGRSRSQWSERTRVQVSVALRVCNADAQGQDRVEKKARSQTPNALCRMWSTRVCTLRSALC